MADDVYYNGGDIKWEPILKTAFVLDQIKQIQEAMSRRLMMPLLGSLVLPYTPTSVLGTLQVQHLTADEIRAEMDLPPLEEPVVIERPDAEWNF